MDRARTDRSYLWQLLTNFKASPQNADANCEANIEHNADWAANEPFLFFLQPQQVPPSGQIYNDPSGWAKDGSKGQIAPENLQNSIPTTWDNPVCPPYKLFEA